MIQDIVVFILFTASIVYLGSLFWKQRQKASNSCSTSCAGCSAIDVEKIASKAKSN